MSYAEGDYVWIVDHQESLVPGRPIGRRLGLILRLVSKNPVCYYVKFLDKLSPRIGECVPFYMKPVHSLEALALQAE